MAIQNTNNSNIPFFFILGRPRSGTTLIQSILDAHQNVIIPSECKVILDLYFKFGHSKELTQTLIEKIISELRQLHKIENWNINFDEVKKDLENEKGEFHFQQLIEIIYLNFQSAFSKKNILALGDKNPAYSKFPKLLLKIFPDAKFIHIIRDYRDHYLSVKKTGLINALETVTIFLWKRSIIRMEKFAKKYPNQFLNVRYEDFVSNPENNLKQICSFLDIEFSSELLNFHKSREKTLNQYKEKNIDKFHKKVYTPIDANNTQKWKRELSDREIIIADYIVGKTANEYGYEKKYNNFSFKLKFGQTLRLMLIKLHFYYLAILKVFPVRIRKTIISKTAALDVFYLKFFKS